MFRIKYVIEKRKYEIHSSQFGAFEGTLVQVTEKALEMGISQDELTEAYEIMNDNRDTVAEFGINGSFMYSHKGKEVA